MNILTVNLLFSTFVFWVGARIYVRQKLGDLGPRTLLLPILLLHAFRRLELMFLSPGATYAGIPPQFVYPAAFVDHTDWFFVTSCPDKPADSEGVRSSTYLDGFAVYQDLDG